MASFYANENFPRGVVLALRALGHDVLTTAEAGNAGQGVPDKDVLKFAIRTGRAILTLNRRDFIRLSRYCDSCWLPERDHAGAQCHFATTQFSPVRHCGIIVCTQDPDLQGQAERIHGASAAMASLDGQLIRVHRPSAH